MNTEQSHSCGPRGREQLLEKLSSMKTEGVGVQDRLRYLAELPPLELRERFTLEDAFDAEREVLSSRLEQLAELDGTVRQLSSSWRGSPLEELELRAGAALLELLAELVKEAKRRELRSESELLSQVWTWAPDISGTWPWLTAWKDPRVKELAGTWHRELLEEVELEPSRREFELRREDEPMARAFELAEVRDVTEPRVQDWTQALRDVTLEKWEFRFAADAHVGGRGMGRAWLWTLEDGDGYAKLEVTDNVIRLSASSPRLREEGDGVRQLERELTSRQMGDVFIDPTQLVLEAFGAP